MAIAAINPALTRYVAESIQKAIQTLAPRARNQQPGEGIPGDVRDRFAGPQRGIGRHQVFFVDDPRHDRGLGRPEEETHRRDREHDRIDQRDVRLTTNGMIATRSARMRSLAIITRF